MSDRPLNGPVVAVLAYDGLCTFEFGVAFEVFGLDRPEMGAGWYRYRLVGIEPGRLRAAGGLFVETDGDLSLLDTADLIIVPGWRGKDEPIPAALCQALNRAQARGCSIASLCSGVFVLAAAGLLDGRRATTHWRYAASLAARFPEVVVEPDVLYVDNGLLLTAAGSAAAIDLCLHIVRKDFGAEAANRVARRLVVPPHRDGGQAQFIERPVLQAFESQRLGALIDWMRNHVSEDLSLAMLADKAGMSLRTFQRRFEEMTGQAPGQWLIMERIQRAREVLERKAEIDLDAVAAICGFGAAGTLRHHFRRLVGVSPSSYRQRFAIRATSLSSRSEVG